jgi:hypothetical protein
MKVKGVTLTELAAVVVVILLLVGILIPGLNRSRQTAIRLACEANLTGLGRAMSVWADDNNGRYPRAGPAGCFWSPWGRLRRWDHPDEQEAFERGEATVTSSFYLLIKYYGLKPEQFVCKGDKGAMAFKIRYVGRTRIGQLSQAWDFGDGGAWLGIPPGGYCSYAYHLPYSRSSGDWTSFAISTECYPATPVCADRNPHLDMNAIGGDVNSNSAAHLGRGQNVLYRDGHVRFETRVTVGLGGDNIYTYGGDPWLGGGDPEGTPPAGNGDGFPEGAKDAYLVGEKNFY